MQNISTSICFYLGFTARQDYFTPFEPSQSLGGAKSEVHEKNKQNLACLTYGQFYGRLEPTPVR